MAMGGLISAWVSSWLWSVVLVTIELEALGMDPILYDVRIGCRLPVWDGGRLEPACLAPERCWDRAFTGGLLGAGGLIEELATDSWKEGFSMFCLGGPALKEGPPMESRMACDPMLCLDATEWCDGAAVRSRRGGAALDT
mmetsp:Transcript_17349/g.52309  ORF Transcript_17349/g.52309 Transcript_17349/m.52309 type:complete len:140 (+) Transcript_17349:57-476(+)